MSEGEGGSGVDLTIGVVGAPRSGKSSIISNFVLGTTAREYIPTVEDSYSKPLVEDGHLFTLAIREFGGREELWEDIVGDVARCQAYILVFSLVDKESLKAADWWMGQLRDIKAAEGKEGRPAGGKEPVVSRSLPIVLVGTHVDRPDNEKEADDGESWAARNKLEAYVEVSGTEGINLSSLFHKVVNTWKSSTGRTGDGKTRGWMKKDSGKVVGGSKRRWFVLDGLSLAFYDKKEDESKGVSAAKGILNLAGASTSHSDAGHRKLHIEGPALNSEKENKQVYTLICEDAESWQRWKSAMEAEIRRERKN